MVIRHKGVSIWLNAEIETLLRRIKRRTDRPLLKGGDPAKRLRELVSHRYPVYAEADLTVLSRDEPHEAVVEEIVAALARRFAPRVGEPAVRTQEGA